MLVWPTGSFGRAVPTTTLPFLICRRNGLLEKSSSLTWLGYREPSSNLLPAVPHVTSHRPHDTESPQHSASAAARSTARRVPF